MEKRQPVIVTLDDFGPSFITDSTIVNLWKLWYKYHEFKITLFTVPKDCDEDWLRKIKQELPFAELAIHGTNHIEVDEWEVSETEAVTLFNKVYNPEFYVRGFKAPWWRLSEEAYNGLRDADIWVAVNKTNKYVKNDDKLSYKYDTGKELIVDGDYNTGTYNTWHGHIPRQSANGLDEQINLMLNRWNPDSEFVFVSEYINKEKRNG